MTQNKDKKVYTNVSGSMEINTKHKRLEIEIVLLSRSNIN